MAQTSKPPATRFNTVSAIAASSIQANSLLVIRLQRPPPTGPAQRLTKNTPTKAQTAPTRRDSRHRIAPLCCPFSLFSRRLPLFLRGHQFQHPVVSHSSHHDRCALPTCSYTPPTSSAHKSCTYKSAAALTPRRTSPSAKMPTFNPFSSVTGRNSYSLFDIRYVSALCCWPLLRQTLKHH